MRRVTKASKVLVLFWLPLFLRVTSYLFTKGIYDTTSGIEKISQNQIKEDKENLIPTSEYQVLNCQKGTVSASNLTNSRYPSGIS